MSNREWLYQQNAKRRRLSDMQLRMQIEQQNIQNFLLLNTDTMSYMSGGASVGSFQFDTIDEIIKAFNEGDFDFSSSDDFCVEWFQYHYDVPHTPRSTIFSINNLTAFGVSFESNLLTLWIGNGDAPILQVDFEEEQYTEKWMHVAIIRLDGVIYVYKNGIKVFSIEDTSAQIEDFFPLTIGSDEIYREETLFQGLISNFRFVIGNSVYDGGSTIEYPNSAVQDITGARLVLPALSNLPFKDMSSYDRKVVYSAMYNTISPFPFDPEIFIPPHHRLEYDFSNLLSYTGTGATVTDLKDGIDGKLFNSPTYTGTGPKYITFNGTNQYLITTSDLSPYFIEDPNKITLSMWVYPMDNGVILSEKGSSSISSIWHDAQIVMVGGTANFGMWNVNNTLSSFISSVPTPLNNWYHLAMKYDGNELFAYVNGVTAGNLSFQMAPPYEYGNGLYYTIAAGDLTSMGDTTYANMRLGAFDVHSIDLSYAEISEEFEASRERFGI